MPKKEVILVNLAAANPNLSPATRFDNLVFAAGQTGRHPVSGEVGKGVREQTHYALLRVGVILSKGSIALLRSRPCGGSKFKSSRELPHFENSRNVERFKVVEKEC
jgi:hypothetical protein